MVDLYPVPIQIVPSERSAPQIVPLVELQRWARITGSSDAHRQDMAGITTPGMRANPRNIQFTRQFHDGIPQFRYRGGSLEIQLWNQIYLSDRLGECERRIWETHEQDHVRDYVQLSGPLMRRLQDNTFMQEFFVERRWYPDTTESIRRIAASFERECTQIWQDLTRAAVQQRDTPAEYERVRALVRQTCAGHMRRATRRASERR